MKLNTSLNSFKKKHKNKKNQIIYNTLVCKNNKIIENIINNFLLKKNSFIFESVEKRRIRGRYTILGADPDKIWEFNKKKINLIYKKKKIEIKSKPYPFLKKLIQDFNFPTPKEIPPLCSLLVGYFSYDIIRYIEKVPDNCLDDLKIPDIRLMRPKTLIIFDNQLKKIFFIINCFSDEKINNYLKYYNEQIYNIQKLKNLMFSLHKNKIINKRKTKNKIMVNSNISKKRFKKIVLKAKNLLEKAIYFRLFLAKDLNRSSLNLHWRFIKN